ncbi:MAG TPA: amino acid-binding ACT domain-containing protein [Thermoanaerobaculia bacterium]
MHDLTIHLPNHPGTLAAMGEALGAAGVSIEGGGVFSGVAHFLFHDGHAAADALTATRIDVAAINEVVTVRLRQGEPGQLGKLARRMADAGVNIEVQYSDHDHQLILVVDDLARGRAVAAEWMADCR